MAFNLVVSSIFGQTLSAAVEESLTLVTSAVEAPPNYPVSSIIARQVNPISSILGQISSALGGGSSAFASVSSTARAPPNVVVSSLLGQASSAVGGGSSALASVSSTTRAPPNVPLSSILGQISSAIGGGSSAAASATPAAQAPPTSTFRGQISSFLEPSPPTSPPNQIPATTVAASRTVSAVSDSYTNSASTSGFITTTKVSPISSSTIVTTSTFPSTSASSPSNLHNGGLSIGAKAGIGVGVPVIVLLIAGLLFTLWRRKRQTIPSSDHNEPTQDYNAEKEHIGPMTPAYEQHRHTTKLELDSKAVGMNPTFDRRNATKYELDGTMPIYRSELASPPNNFRSELGSTPIASRADLHSPTSAMSPPPPMYAHHQPPNAYQSGMHELPTNVPKRRELPRSVHSLASQPHELGNTYTAPTSMEPTVAVSTQYRGNEDQIEQLRAQRAVVARERERKEEIERMRAEEDRLDRAIAELESRRQ